MNERSRELTIREHDKFIDLLQKIDANRQCFMIVIDKFAVAHWVLTDVDIRRAIIRDGTVAESASTHTMDARIVYVSEGLETVTELFKNQEI